MGPLFSVNGELFCDFKFATFSCTKRRPHQTDAEEKSLAASMKRALQPAVCRHEFPNFQVDIYAIVLQDDGGVLAAAITCAGLALADAGIPMYDVITAASAGFVSDRVLADPNAAEEDVCNNVAAADADHGTCVMACLATHDQVSELWQTGAMQMSTITRMNAQLTAMNAELVPIIKHLLVKKVLDAERKAKESEQEEISTAAE